MAGAIVDTREILPLFEEKALQGRSMRGERLVSALMLGHPNAQRFKRDPVFAGQVRIDKGLAVELKDVGIFAVMPYLAGVVFDNVWAVLIDHLIASGTLSTLGARKFSQVVAFAAPSLCIGVLLGLGERVTPALASALFSAALGMNMASHSGYWANLIDIAPTKAGFALGVSNTIGNIPGMPAEHCIGWFGTCAHPNWQVSTATS